MGKLFFVLLLLTSAETFAKRCLKLDSQNIQNQALALYKKQNYKKAADLVGNFLDGCSGSNTNEGLLSDYSLYLYKAGRYDECLNRFSSLVYPTNQPEDEKIAEAIQHNFNLCRTAREKLLGEKLKTSNCSLTSKEVPKGSIELPMDMLAPASKLACVGFENNQNDECRRLILIERNTKTGLLKKTILNDKTEDSILSDSSFCCWVDAPALIKRDGRTHLYFRGQGRSCDGGTMDGEIMSVYHLDGANLKLKEKVDITYH